MDEKPKRRWFRFRISTVLILTAILAWGMATRPNIDYGSQNFAIDSSSPGMGFHVNTH